MEFAFFISTFFLSWFAACGVYAIEESFLRHIKDAAQFCAGAALSAAAVIPLASCVAV